MARTQFSFTFTNAQPGSAVRFFNSAHEPIDVYLDATTKQPDGRPVILDSSNSVSIYADASVVVATTVDGAGVEISGTAQPGGSVTVADGTAGHNPFSSGGSSAGAPVVRKFPFAFDASGLVTGHALYTPTVGDVLLNAWVEIDTAWNGTTPKLDVGTFPSTTGWIGSVAPSSVIDPTVADNTSFFGAGLLTQDSAGTNNTELWQALWNWGARVFPVKFSAATPIKVCVSTTGATNGSDPGSTQGAATLYLVTATPA